MKYGVYTLYDKIAEDCGPLFVARTDMEGVRIAQHSLKDVQFKEDFGLVFLGHYFSGNDPKIIGTDPRYVDIADSPVDMAKSNVKTNVEVEDQK